MNITRVLAFWLAVSLLLAPQVCAQDSGSAPPAVKSDSGSGLPPVQNKELPDAPKPQAKIYRDPIPARGYRGPMPSHGFRQKDGGASPQFGFRQVADKNYWYMAVVLPSAASAFDGISTFHGISLGNSEVNPLLGSHPKAGVVAGLKLGAGVVQAVCLYHLKKADMQNDYAGVKRDEFPPRWWK